MPRKAYFYFKMRFTTVAVLVFFFVGCCNAQNRVSTSALQKLTDIRNGSVTAPYLQRDSAHALLEIPAGRSFDDARENGVRIVRTLNEKFAIVQVSHQDVGFLASVGGRTQPVNYLWKLSDNLVSDDLKTKASYIIQTSNPHRLVSILARFDLKLEEKSEYLIAHGDLSTAISLILLDDEVTYFGRESLLPIEDGRVLDLYHGPNKVNKIHNDYPELNGEGIVV
jgi:hypothetical protein